MTEIIGLDHLYITVSDMARSEGFYDRAMKVLGFRKNAFTLDGDPHAQYFNRHFGFVIRPARSANPHDPYSPGLHHLCFRVDSIEDVVAVANDLRAAGVEISGPKLFIPAMPPTTGRRSSPIPTASGWRSPNTGRSGGTGMTGGTHFRRSQARGVERMPSRERVEAEEFARHFAEDGIVSWTSHDLARILSHCAS